MGVHPRPEVWHRSVVGLEVLALLVMTIALPFVAVGFAVHYRARGLEKARFESAWESFSRARGYRFVPASGEWPNVTSARVEWEEPSGAKMRLEAVLREGALSTRLTARPSALLLGRALVSTREGRRAMPRCTTGDAAFDAVFVTSERPAGFVSRVLSADVRRALLAFRMGKYLALRYRRGDLSLVWDDGEENPARLDEARALLSTCTAAVEEAFVVPSVRHLKASSE